MKKKYLIFNVNSKKFVLGNSFFNRRKDIFLFTTLLLFIFCFTSVSNGQDFPLDTEPPPLKLISKQEKKELDSQTKIKKRTKLALELMDIRLMRAEEASSKNEFKVMFTELGRFHALIDDTLRFLTKRNNDSRKILYNFKRFEIGLRKLLPRIELIRRDLPLRYEFYVRTLIKNVREARSRAVEPMFDDSVISDDGK